MKTQKLTQQQIAKDIGTSQGAVSLWFIFKNKPSRKNANAMKRLYGWDTEIWDDPQRLKAFVKNNTHLFGSLKILRKAKNGSAEV